MFSLVMYRVTRAGQKCPSGIYVKDLFDLIGNFLDDGHLTDVMKNKSNWICEHTGLRTIFTPLERTHKKPIMFLLHNNRHLVSIW